MLRLAPPAAVLFDVGDTLLVEERFDLEAGIAAAVGQSATVPALANAFRVDLALSHRSQHELSLAAWLQQHVPALATESVDSLEGRVWPAVVSLAPAPGALAVLTRLASDGVRMAAVSNAAFSSRCLSRELERLRFGPYLAFVISSADVGRRKPQP
jgi:FMN phosphatase YigB (HAD superfamily)